MKTKRTGKQWAALIAVILIGVLILATLLTAIFDSTGRMFQACLVAMIGVPILAWIYIWIYGIYSQKHTMAAMDLLGSEKLSEEEKMMLAATGAMADETSADEVMADEAIVGEAIVGEASATETSIDEEVKGETEE